MKEKGGGKGEELLIQEGRWFDITAYAACEASPGGRRGIGGSGMCGGEREGLSQTPTN